MVCPGVRPGPQGEPAQVHLITVGQPVMGERAAPGGRAEDFRAVAGGELAGPGQEIGMQVGFRRERDPQPIPAGGGPHRPQVP